MLSSANGLAPWADDSRVECSGHERVERIERAVTINAVTAWRLTASGSARTRFALNDGLGKEVRLR